MIGARRVRFGSNVHGQPGKSRTAVVHGVYSHSVVARPSPFQVSLSHGKMNSMPIGIKVWSWCLNSSSRTVALCFIVTVALPELEALIPIIP